MSAEKCMRCEAKLIPVGFTPQAGKTATRLYWIETLQDFMCKTCLIDGAIRAEAAEARAAELAAQVEQLTNEKSFLSIRVDELQAEVSRLEAINNDLDGFDMSFAAIVLKDKIRTTSNANVGIRHAEYEGEYETPIGIALDGMGDEVEG